jgi:hypothetical protein
MKAEFASCPLLLEDPLGEVQAWLDRYLSIDDLSLFGWPYGSYANRRTAARRSARNSRSLPVMNWPAPPPPRINTLYWPTGATRWAVGLFLVDGQSLRTIQEYVAETGAATLRIGSDDTWVIDARMHLLPPKRISYARQKSEELWLLPLVDERFFWREESIDRSVRINNDPAEQLTTWEDLFETIGFSLGLSIETGVIPDEYAYPDKTELERLCDDPAALLDAAAASVGCRIVRRLDGVVELQDYGSAQDIHEANLEGDDSGQGSDVPESEESEGDDDVPCDLIAGGEGAEDLRRLAVPRYVQVVFPVYTGGCLHRRGRVNAVVVDAEQVEIFEYRDGCRTFFDTAYADVPTGDDEEPGADAEASEAENQEDLDALARQVAEDYLHWNVLHFDATMPGILDWRPSGYYDYLLFYVGHRHRREEARGFRAADEAQSLLSPYACMTRVTTLPCDVYPQSLLHQWELAGWGTDLYEPAALMRRFELSEDLTPVDEDGKPKGTPALLVKWKRAGSESGSEDSEAGSSGGQEDEDDWVTDEDVAFEVWDPLKRSAKAKTRGWAKWMPDSDRWEIVYLESGEPHFELMEPLVKYAATPVPARPRNYDPSNGGRHVTDCEAPQIWVKDIAGTGFSGGVGAVGWGVWKDVDPMEIDGVTVTRVVEIHGLQCPPEQTSTCQ